MEPASRVVFADDVCVINVRVINGVHSFDEAAALPPASPCCVTFAQGRVSAVGGTPAGSPALVIDGSGLFLLPGLIDLQLNDFAWFDKARSASEADARLDTMTRAMWAEGCTSFVLTSLASPWEPLLEYLRATDAFRRRSMRLGLHVTHTSLLGVMVEGTFMNKLYHGCHNQDYVHEVGADWQSQLKAILDTGSIFAVNLAPETNARESSHFIRYAKERGALVAIGHCQPTGAELRDAIAAGVDYVVHLGNGATGFSWKRFNRGGMLEECLSNDSIHATIIGDGFHVSKRYVRDWVQRKELHRATLVTDRAYALDAPESTFTVFGVTGRVENTSKGSFLRIWQEGDLSAEQLLNEKHVQKPFRLFGAHANMLTNFENALNWYRRPMAGINVRLHPGFALEQACSIAVTLCSTNPARVARQADSLGRIAPGFVGNAVLCKLVTGEGGRVSVQIVHVFIGC